MAYKRSYRRPIYAGGTTVVGYNGLLRFRRNSKPRGYVNGKPKYGYSTYGYRYGTPSKNWFRIVSNNHRKSILGY